MGKHLAPGDKPRRPRAVRACPIDFATVFIESGWNGVRDHFGMHSRTLRRCVEENGGAELKARRREYLRQNGRSDIWGDRRWHSGLPGALGPVEAPQSSVYRGLEA